MTVDTQALRALASSPDPLFEQGDMDLVLAAADDLDATRADLKTLDVALTDEKVASGRQGIARRVAERERDAARAEVARLRAQIIRIKGDRGQSEDEAIRGAELVEARAEVARLRAALTWYADRETWEYRKSDLDRGDCARAALEERT